MFQEERWMKNCKGPEWAHRAIYKIVIGIMCIFAATAIQKIVMGINMSIFAVRAIHNKIVVGISMSIFAGKYCWLSTTQPLHIPCHFPWNSHIGFHCSSMWSERQPSSLFRFYNPTHKLLLTKPIRSVPFEPNFCYSPSRPIIEPTCCRLCSLPEYDHIWLPQRGGKWWMAKTHVYT